MRAFKTVSDDIQWDTETPADIARNRRAMMIRARKVMKPASLWERFISWLDQPVF